MASKNRVSVFLRTQNPARELPSHRCSPRFALLVLSSSLARTLTKDYKAIQLTTDEPWQKTKDRFRAYEPGTPVVPLIKPPLESYSVFMMSYPPTMYETDAASRRETLWMSGANKPHERR